MLLFIIRHGDPIYDPDSLTKKGHWQAQALGKRLAMHGLDRIFSSPMIRAQQTAQPTCDLLHKTAQIEDWMSEDTLWKESAIQREDGVTTWPFHALDNTVFRSEENYALGEEWINMPCFHRMKENGAYDRIVRCSDDFLARLGYRREGHVYRIEKASEERVAAFCHQGFGTTWLSHLLQIPPHLFWSSFDLSHTGVTVLEFANRPNGLTAPKCLCLSDLSHLYGEGLPLQFENRVNL